MVTPDAALKRRTTRTGPFLDFFSSLSAVPFADHVSRECPAKATKAATGHRAMVVGLFVHPAAVQCMSFMPPPVPPDCESILTLATCSEPSLVMLPVTCT